MSSILKKKKEEEEEEAEEEEERKKQRRKKRKDRQTRPESMLSFSSRRVGTQQEGSRAHVRKRALTGNRACWHIDLRLLSLQN